MKENNNFDEQFEDFAYNRFTSNATEEIEELETDFNNICSKIQQQVDIETKKLLEYLIAKHNDLLATTIRKSYSLGLTDYIHLTSLSK